MKFSLLPLLPFALGSLVCLVPAHAQRFSFSQPDDSDKQEQAARAARIASDLSVPCRADLKNKKIMVVIGERRSNGFVEAHQQNYGEHYRAINTRLQALGLRTYTPEEIKRQIAQAEIDADSAASVTIRMPHCRRRDDLAQASCCAGSFRRRRRQTRC